MRKTGQEDDQPGLPKPDWSVAIADEVPPSTPMHPMAPWTDVTFAGVYWQEGERLRTLLKTVRPWFQNIVVGIQKGKDNTLVIAKEYANVVIEDVHHGYAEPTIQKVLDAIRTQWTFFVSGDEMPSADLLYSFQNMMNVWWKNRSVDSFWVPFHSSIEGFDFTAETDGHTRIFVTRRGWPKHMHSSPQTSKTHVWKDGGFISHDRSLDEMIIDYLRYYKLGKGNRDWEAHNALMMREACRGVAGRIGWENVQANPWWAEVEAISFKNEKPWIVDAGVAEAVSSGEIPSSKIDELVAV